MLIAYIDRRHDELGLIPVNTVNRVVVSVSRDILRDKEFTFIKVIIVCALILVFKSRVLL
jgi:hypothetical protein